MVEKREKHRPPEYRLTKDNPGRDDEYQGETPFPIHEVARVVDLSAEVDRLREETATLRADPSPGHKVIAALTNHNERLMVQNEGLSNISLDLRNEVERHRSQLAALVTKLHERDELVHELRRKIVTLRQENEMVHGANRALQDHYGKQKGD